MQEEVPDHTNRCQSYDRHSRSKAVQSINQIHRVRYTKDPKQSRRQT